MTKTFKDIQGIEEACWVGYKKVGMKKKGDRMVPNCVKEEVVDNLLGKDYVYESVADMYKGQFTKAQLAKMKQTWATKKASDVDQRTKDFVRNLDQFSQMDIKQANIKYISNLIDEVQKEEVELVNDFKNIIEENEMRSSIRRSEDLKEFNSDQLERLAKAYSVMKGKNISVDNANKLGKMMNGVPDSSLNALRKKKIPFLSGLALSRMIQRKIPVTESVYLDEARWHIEGNVEYRGIRSGDDFDMVIDAPTESAAEDKAYKELDKARAKRKIGPGGGGSIENVEIHQIERTNDRLQGPETFSMGNSFDPRLKEANMKRILGALQDKLSKEGGAAGFDDLKKTAKSMGLDLTPAMLKDMPGIKQHRDGDYILETFTLKKYKENERENDHSLNAIMLVKQFGTDKELKDVEDIDKRHKKAGSISQSDLAKRNQISNKYYKRLK